MVLRIFSAKSRKVNLDKRAQVSFEYILVVGMIMLFIITGIGFVYNYSQRSTDQIALTNIEKAGQDLILTAEKVYYIGSNSWETIRISLPPNVVGVYVVSDSELVIEYDSFGGLSQSVFFSDVNITAPYFVDGKFYISDFPHPGVSVIRVTSHGSFVNITEVN